MRSFRNALKPTAALVHVKGTVTAVAPLAVSIAGSAPVLVMDGMPWWRHAVNDDVLVERVGSLARVVATDARRPQSGTVASATSTLATVTATVDGKAWSQAMPWTGTAPAVGALVEIRWGSEGAACAALSAPIAAPLEGPDRANAGDSAAALPSTILPTTLTAYPIQIGTARDGAWTAIPEAQQGQEVSSLGDSTGYFFYGSQFEGLSGVVVTGASIRLQRTSEGAVTPLTFWLHDELTRPDDPPALLPASASTSFDSAVTSPLETLTLPLPADFAQQLADQVASGIAVSAVGLAAFAELAGIDGYNQWASSGALSLKYVRS